MRYGRSEAVLIRSRNSTSSETFIALQIRFFSNDEYPVETVEVIDADELESLNRALKHMVANRERMSEHATTYTEATYKSRGGFVLGMYVDGKKRGEFLQIGHQSAFLTALEELQRVIDDALFKIEVMSTSSPLLTQPQE